MDFDNASSSEDEEPDVISRAEWGARPAQRVREYESPPADIVYSETETKTCSSRQECVKLIQDIQSYHMDVRGLPDIQFNFLIGGDGGVYEGRGWNYIGQVNPQQHSLPADIRERVIEVAFIGDFSEKAPPRSMTKVAAGLILAGVNNNNIVLTKRRDEMLTEEEVEALKKKGAVVIKGYGNKEDMLLSELLQQNQDKNKNGTNERKDPRAN